MRTTEGINFHGFKSCSSVFGGFSNPISCKACLKLKAPFLGRASPSRSRFKRRRTSEGSTSPMLTMSGVFLKNDQTITSKNRRQATSRILQGTFNISFFFRIHSMADPKRAAKSGTLSQKEVLAIDKQSDGPLCMQNAEMVANGDFFTL